MEYARPLILSERKVLQETIYVDCVKYAKILIGDEFPWSDLYNDVRRSEIHKALTVYCDCDENFITETFDSVFTMQDRSDDEDFPEKIDKWINKLKEIASRPENERHPTIDASKLDLSALQEIPTMGVSL